MELGAFSISLAVKDIAASKAFYEKLGFEQTGGEGPYAIMVNGTTIIGLFQGMFDKNILTFNPGLSNTRESITSFAPAEDFTDVRDLQARLKAEGIELTDETDPDGTGVGSFTVIDPDGNPILVDQHFPKPETR